MNLEGITEFFERNSVGAFDPELFLGWNPKFSILRNVPFPVAPILIAGFGSAGEAGSFDDELPLVKYAKKAARQATWELVNYPDLVFVTGLCPDNSIPTQMAMELKLIRDNIPILGISPAKSYEHLLANTDKPYGLAMKCHDYVLWTGTQTEKNSARFTIRDDINAEMADGCIAVRGSSGTHHEVSSMSEGGKVVGLMAGTGGIVDKVGGVFEATREDGKHHFVWFYEANPEELARKVMAQAYIDRCLRDGKQATAFDVYTHVSTVRGVVEPVVNLRRLRAHDPHDWKNSPVRHYPFNFFQRPDMRYDGKILLGVEKDQVREILYHTLGTEVMHVAPKKPGEVGDFYFPSTVGAHSKVASVATRLLDQGGRTVLYQNFDRRAA